MTRDDLLKACAAPLPSERVEVPEFGGAVYVRGMSGTERDAFETSFLTARRRHTTPANVRARLAVCCLVDEQGQRLFTDGDFEAVGHMRADVLDRLCAIAQRLSGLIATDISELAAVSALGKDA